MFFLKKMKNKKIIYAVLTLLFIGALIFAVLNNGADKTAEIKIPASSAGVLSVLNNNFNFEVLEMKDGKVTHNFKVKNNGSEPVVITKAYTSCACTTATIINSSGDKYGLFGMQGHKGLTLDTAIEIKPGESAMVTAIYDPAAHGPKGVGKVKRIIYLDTNSTAKPQTQVVFEATVVNN